MIKPLKTWLLLRKIVERPVEETPVQIKRIDSNVAEGFVWYTPPAPKSKKHGLSKEEKFTKYTVELAGIDVVGILPGDSVLVEEVMVETIGEDYYVIPSQYVIGILR